MYTMNNSGQTILELLVVLLLIILFLSGIVVVQLYSIRNVQYSQNKSQATKLAREQLERARVVRDSGGMSVFETYCQIDTGCYINNQLTPVAMTPTGTFGQSLTVKASSECPVPTGITPTPVIYKATSRVYWGGASGGITPAPELTISSCISDWR